VGPAKAEPWGGVGCTPMVPASSRRRKPGTSSMEAMGRSGREDGGKEPDASGSILGDSGATT